MLDCHKFSQLACDNLEHFRSRFSIVCYTDYFSFLVVQGIHSNFFPHVYESAEKIPEKTPKLGVK